MNIKATDIISEKVSKLWKRLRPIWEAANGFSSKTDISTIEFIVPVWAMVCWDANVLVTQRDLLAWVGRIARHSLIDVVGDLKTLDQMYLRCDPSIGSVNTDYVVPFKRAYQEIKYEHLVISADLGKSLQKLRTASLFLTHLTLHLGQECDSLDSFEANLDRISAVHTLPTEFMQTWIARLFKDVEPFGDFYLPRHGNGAVAEKGIDHIQKWKLTSTSAVKYSLRGYDQDFLPDFLKTSTIAIHKTNRCARVITVPKGIDKRRIVCPEPAALMFIQQGLRNVIYRAVRLSKLTNSHIDFRDGNKNAELAKEGSINGLYATIDLSSASDSVRWEFVDTLFAKVPKWRRALQLSRSTFRMLPDGSVKPNVHFAPMGSALCFPIQTLCYCALCEEAIALDGGANRTYRVYGDDIIIHESHYFTLINLLTNYGWIVNEDKTFHGNNGFRESCGGHYIYGRDVTPVLAGRKLRWNTSKNIARQLSPIVDLHNRLYKDYAASRRMIALILRDTEVIDKIKIHCKSGKVITRTRKRNIEIIHTDVAQDSTKLFSDHPANLMKVRDACSQPSSSEDPWYQKEYYYSMVPRSKGKIIHLSEELRYFEYFTTKCSEPITYKTEANEHWVWSWAPLW